MTNNTRNAIYACLLLLAITVGACVKDSTVPESIHKQPQDFQLADARKHYEENIENLCFPEIYLKPIIYTKGSNYFHNLKQTPLWDRFNFTENGWSYIYEIPIIYNITLKASMGHLTQDGHLKKEDKEVKFQSNLIIQKYKKSENVHIFLSTVIGYISEPDNEIEGESPWLWTGNRRNFTGYQFFTNPDGSFRSAFQYKDSHRTSIILSLYDKNEEYVFPQSFFSISLGSLGTKGEGIQEYKKYCWDCQREFDWTESYCPQCGTMLEVLDEITVIPQPDHICDKCNFLIENCVCEDYDYGDEDQCPYCHLPDCSGECRNTGGDGTGSGGTTPGGNQDSIEYYIVNVVTKGNGTAYGSGTYSLGDEVHLEANPNENHVFNGWSNKGAFFSSSSSFSFVIDDNYDLIANFNPKDSECGRLALKYTNNSSLSNTISLLNSKISENGNIEYGYAKPENMEDVLYVGTTDKVNIVLNANMDYEYVIHNHPVSNSLIPSIEDLAFYYTEICKGTLKNTSLFLIRASNDIISFEVENFNKFRSFINDVVQTEDTIDDYRSAFHKYVLGNPKHEDLGKQSVIEKALKFYAERGLKITYAKKINNTYTWSNVSVNGTTVNYLNCLN